MEIGLLQLIMVIFNYQLTIQDMGIIENKKEFDTNNTNMQSDTYFETQQAALEYSDTMAKSKGYQPQYPEYLWCEHVSYGSNRKYCIPLLTSRGNPARKHLHISLYRMDSGRYELTTWLQ